MRHCRLSHSLRFALFLLPRRFLSLQLGLSLPLLCLVIRVVGHDVAPRLLCAMQAEGCSGGATLHAPGWRPQHAKGTFRLDEYLITS